MILTGKEVASSINDITRSKVDSLSKLQITPTLATIRVGEREDDKSYERGASKRCEMLGIKVINVVLPEAIEQEKFMNELKSLNDDSDIHGILMFRPLPSHLDETAARMAISPLKDIDGCTDGSLAGVFTNTDMGYPPCTAQASIDILKYNGVQLEGKNVTVIGRSLVVGRPLAMMLMHENATVTICHTKTKDMQLITRQSDIVIVCAGKTDSIGKEYFSPGQIVIDVGIGLSERTKKLSGDVKFDEVMPIVGSITPVPNGVGSVTSSVLALHVAMAAESLSK